ncbi:MAG: EAL domain-containing protein [Lachnospiraceae bacterium]|nr:EAL domain-containing protein [Lachnospiraceae bacterium]
MLYHNIDFLVSAFLIYAICVYCLVAKKGIRNIQNKSFVLFIALSMVACASDLAGYVLTYFYGQTPLWTRDILNLVYHFAHCMTIYVVCLYMLTITGRYHRLKKTTNLLLLSPTLIFYFFLFLNPIYHWAFTYDEQGIYVRGPVILIEYVAAAIYFVIITYLLLRFQKAISRGNLVSLLMLFGSAIGGIIVQMLYPNLIIELFIESLGTLIGILSIENKDEVYDPMTNLYNRQSFIQENRTNIYSDSEYFLIIMKLVNFRHFTSAIGEFHVNEIFKIIAHWLLGIKGKGKVFFCGNGTFALMMFRNEFDQYKEKLHLVQEKFSEPWTYGDYTVAFNTQIYAIHVPQELQSVDEILAIMNMDHVTDNNEVSVYTGTSLKILQREVEVAQAIERALEARSFRVYYQPIWSRMDGKIHSAEALIRLTDDKIGFISPEEFITIAERNGTIGEIGTFVFETVCRDYSERNMQTYGIDYIEVNLSPVQCMKSDMADVFEGIMRHYHVLPKTINLEITESAAANSPEMFSKAMTQLQAMGFTFSLDDFGKGYSNVTNLSAESEYHIIKIDKDLLWNSEKSPAAHIILDHIIRMIQEIGMEIVVEGVETKKQWEYLKMSGVDFCQGYYFSKPVDCDKFLEYVKAFNAEKD